MARLKITSKHPGTINQLSLKENAYIRKAKNYKKLTTIITIISILEALFIIYKVR